MLFSPFSSPRRLALLAVFILFTVAILLRNSQYSQRLPGQGFTPSRPESQQVPPTKGRPDQPWKEDGHNNAVLPDPHDALVAAKPKPEHKKTTTTSTSKHIELPTHAPAKPINYLDDKITPIRHISYEDQQNKIKELIRWEPLNTDRHWPSWDAYRNADYDPNRWEGFDWEAAYFTENGVRRLEHESGLKPEVYLPYPDYNTPSWKAQWKGEYNACEGPRGKLLNESMDDMVKAYRSSPPNFPNVTLGSVDLMGLDDVCFDRFHRYGPYGFGQTQTDTPAGWEKPTDRPEWSSIWWGQLQDACLQRNKDRFAPEARAPMNLVPDDDLPTDSEILIDSESQQSHHDVMPKYHQRTALLIRTWEGYHYTENDLQAIRALVTELSLLTGGEYQVYLFVNVKEHDADIYNNPQVYQDVLKRVVPRELRDIALLWTEKVCEQWYPKVGDWQVYWQQFMPLQWFSKTHPEFDYVWNWETDARYTGNHFHFLEKVVEFARNMPRKHLWERNTRFYFPDEHGNYASFLADTDAMIRNATAQGLRTPVWGPQKFDPRQTVFGPVPPRPQEQDNFEWGVGEEADLLTLQPIWDPTQTEWSYRYKIWNFIEGKRPQFSAQDPGDDAYYHPDFAKIQRRVFINTVARFSKKMLHAMHMENRAGRSMQAEMWPATVALQHGLKAVYAPHPIWADRKWPSWFLDATFNADSGEPAAWGQRKDSPYNHDREAAFRGWSWYYSTGFPRVLYRRWLGWKAYDILGDLGGKTYEEGVNAVESFGQFGGNGRMCLPGMLLHPVKKVKEDDGVWGQTRLANAQDAEREKIISQDVERLRREKGFEYS